MQSALREVQGRAPGLALQGVDFHEYVKSFEVAEHVLDGVLQRGRVYALTALTGHGKTAVATTLMAHLACDRGVCGREVQSGLKVLLLSGENDEDQKSRTIATAQEFGLRPAPGRLRVISGSYPIGQAIEEIKRLDAEHGPFGAIVADTSIAFFGGDNENDNPQLREHAATFRELTRLPGRPVVGILCHPVKNAGRDNLLPRGGGAFLNEIDGNLTVWREGERLTLHTQGKFRGAVFEPIHFLLKPVELPMKDAKGRAVRSVVAAPIDEAQADQLAKADWNDENRLLYAMLKWPNDTQRGWARSCSWLGKDGETPLVSKVHRVLQDLERDKLVQRSRGRWGLTPKGKAEAEKPD